MDEEGVGWHVAAPGRRPLLWTWWHLWPAWGLPGRPAWHTTSVGHGFVWEGRRDIFHGHAVHDGAERVQVVGVRGVGCEQMVCREGAGVSGQFTG